MRASELQKASPHDILQAWQDGLICYREAMRLTDCESLFELYQSCRSSGVAIRSDLTDQEMRTGLPPGCRCPEWLVLAARPQEKVSFPGCPLQALQAADIPGRQASPAG